MSEDAWNPLLEIEAVYCATVQTPSRARKVDRMVQRVVDRAWPLRFYYSTHSEPRVVMTDVKRCP